MTTTAPTTHLPRLLSPFDLRGLSLRNRVVMAPLTRARAGRERVPNDLMAEHYRQRASAGLIITEVKGGSPWGAATIAGGDGSRQPSTKELAQARFQGKHVATLAAKLRA